MVERVFGALRFQIASQLRSYISKELSSETGDLVSSHYRSIDLVREIDSSTPSANSPLVSFLL